MLTKNIAIAHQLISGQLSTICKIKFDNLTNDVSVVCVKFDDERAGKDTIRNSGDYYAKINQVVPIKAVSAGIKINPRKFNSAELVRTQFPIALAWACTVHKVQGFTLDQIVISFELNKQTAFQSGQAYVALSRVRTLNGLFILDKFDPKQIKSDQRVTDEYERLHTDSEIGFNLPSVSEDDHGRVTISLLNVRSLARHWEDVVGDTKLMHSHVLVFTETQMIHSSD